MRPTIPLQGVLPSPVASYPPRAIESELAGPHHAHMSSGSSRANLDQARRVEELARVGDPQERLVRATAWLEELRQRQLVVAGIRDAAMQALHEQGLSYAEIARTAGTTRGRVAQIVRGRRAGAAPSGPGAVRSTPADG
jgi:hypothetical protein